MHHGPFPAGADLQALSTARGRYLAGPDLPEADVVRDFELRNIVDSNLTELVDLFRCARLKMSSRARTANVFVDRYSYLRTEDGESAPETALHVELERASEQRIHVRISESAWRWACVEKRHTQTHTHTTQGKS